MQYQLYFRNILLPSFCQSRVHQFYVLTYVELTSDQYRTYQLMQLSICFLCDVILEKERELHKLLRTVQIISLNN